MNFYYHLYFPQRFFLCVKSDIKIFGQVFQSFKQCLKYHILTYIIKTYSIMEVNVNCFMICFYHKRI